MKPPDFDERRGLHITPAQLSVWAQGLRAARLRWLVHWPVRRILQALDEVSRLWLQADLPERLQAIDQIVAHTGFSPEMVGHCITLEMQSSLLPDLDAALRRELGSLESLDDGWHDPALQGWSRATGVPLVGAIFSSNIPALPHLSVMRALLVKSALLGRSSRAEPFFLPLYLQTLSRVAPELARCVAALSWSPEARELTGTFLSEVDHLIAYGGKEALSALAQQLPTSLPVTWHGHKLGFALLLRGALRLPSERRRLAEALAYDFSLFEQQACLSPQLLWIEAAEPEELEDFTSLFIAALEHWKVKLPPRRLSVEALGQRRQLLELLTLRQALGEPVRILTGPSVLQGVVVQTSPEGLMQSPLERFALLVPIAHWQQLLPFLEQARGQLQNVALEGPAPSRSAVRSCLATFGVSRICSAGKMGTPSMMWRHDGGQPLAALVRWCDEEVLAPGERTVELSPPEPGQQQLHSDP